MEYRSPSFTDSGFASEAEERVMLYGFIQDMMQKAGPSDLLDTMLVVTNICEVRALLMTEHPELHVWYTNTAMLLRTALDVLAHKHARHKPHDKLEDQSFYFPETGIAH
jgi:hypothetical protein